MSHFFFKTYLTVYHSQIESNICMYQIEIGFKMDIPDPKNSNVWFQTIPTSSFSSTSSHDHDLMSFNLINMVLLI